MIEVFVDGACRGDDDSGRGQSSIGIVIYKNKVKKGQFSRPIGERTSAEAEYEAVLHAVFWCWTLSALDPDFLRTVIYCDSYQVVQQVNGKWNCKSQTLLPLLHTILKFKKDGFNFTLTHVKRKFVHEADFLANEILDELTSNTNRKGD